MTKDAIILSVAVVDIWKNSQQKLKKSISFISLLFLSYHHIDSD